MPDDGPHAPPDASFDPTLQRRLTGGLRAWRATLGPRLGPLFDRLAEGLQIYRDTWPTWFFHPRGLPVSLLPYWCARIEGGAAIDEARVFDAALSGALGYLHVRVQDDLIDEGRGEPGGAMLLSDALFQGHQRRLLRVVGADAAFWDLFDATWAAYGEAMLYEQALHQGEGVTTQEAFDAVLLRSRPLLLPPAAVLHARGLASLIPDLASFVHHLAAAHQLYMDCLDAEKDLAHHNHTFVVNQCKGEGSLASLRQGLYVRGGMSRIGAQISRALDHAEGHARTLGIFEALEELRARRALASTLEGGTQDALARALLSQLLGDQ